MTVEQNKEEYKRKFRLLTSSRKKQLYLMVLRDALGNVAVACAACGISRVTHYSWVKNEKFAAAVLDISEVALDFVEGHLMKNIKEGKETSTIFYLKTKGKKRGYIETVHTVVQEVVDDISKMSDDDLKALLK